MKFRICLVLAVMAFAVVAYGVEDDRSGRISAIFGYEDEAGEHHHLENSFLDWFHNPTDGLEQGLDLRLRTIWGDNIDRLDDTDANHRYEFQRYRMRFWQKLMINEDIDFNHRWVWESRTWEEPGRKPQSYNIDEVLPDRFNFTIRNFMDMPITAVIGRQDIILGKGWLVLDGTPLDGSRTIFLDAARFTHTLDEQNTLETILVHQAAASNKYIHPINGQDRALTEQDETGIILWLTNKSIENTTLEAFYIYKNDAKVDSVYTNFPGAWSREAEIHTIGGAISGKMDENWSYRLDGAYQTGERESRSTTTINDLEAYGGKAYLQYAFNDEKSNEVHAVFEFLSGDNPNTTDDEAFDPLWGEWPQFSELLIYTYTGEGNSIAEVTNLQRVGVGHSFKASDKLTIKSDYNLLWAHENTASGLGLGTFSFDSSDNFRGQLFTLWLKYQCCTKIKAHTVFEYFIPGDYHESPDADEAFFLRFNFEYSF